MKTILHLCADTGSDSRPYKDGGYKVICIGKEVGVENFNEDTYKYFDEVYGVIANPVCTQFSVASGFHKTLNHEDGLVLVNECKRVIELCKNLKFWVIENPATGHLKDYLGTPRFKYEPWHFGSPWTKETALWGEFNIPTPKYTKWAQVPKNEALYVRPGRPKPSIAFLHKSAKKHIREFDCFTDEDVPDDMSFRSLCSQNFAKAFFEINR